ncbi:MAG: SPOR domain-containing protein [Desulfuromonadaceae bacterium]|nr:SPOR domain-containing protein [Desulfuromonadaceae bacterium]
MTHVDYARSPRKSAKGRVLVVFALVAVLCLISFALGVLVGKSVQPDVQSYPVAVPVVPSARVAAPVGAPPVKTSAPAAPVSSVVSSVPALKEPRVVAPAVEDNGQSDPLHELLPALEQAPLGSGLNRDVAAAGGEKPQPAANQPPAEGVAPPPVPTLLPAGKAATAAAKGSDSYVVQVASFRKLDDARKLERKLSGQFPIQVRTVEVEGKGQWSRVLVGPVSSKEEAVALQGAVKARAGLEGFVKKSDP